MKDTGENAVKNVGMIIKDLEYYIHLVDKAAIGFEKIDSNLETISTVCKMLSNSIPYYREIIHERKNQLTWQNLLLFNCCLRNCHSHSRLQQAPS